MSKSSVRFGPPNVALKFKGKKGHFILSHTEILWHPKWCRPFPASGFHKKGIEGSYHQSKGHGSQTIFKLLFNLHFFQTEIIVIAPVFKFSMFKRVPTYMGWRVDELETLTRKRISWMKMLRSCCSTLAVCGSGFGRKWSLHFLELWLISMTNSLSRGFLARMSVVVFCGLWHTKGYYIRRLFINRGTPKELGQISLAITLGSQISLALTLGSRTYLAIPPKTWLVAEYPWLGI